MNGWPKGGSRYRDYSIPPPPPIKHKDEDMVPINKPFALMTEGDWAEWTAACRKANLKLDMEIAMLERTIAEQKAKGGQ